MTAKKCYSNSLILGVPTGSDVVFVSNVATIQPPLTSSLTQRCSLEDSGSPSGGLVGRRDVAGGGLVGRRDVAASHIDSSVNVKSIVIQQNGRHSFCQ